MEKMREIVIIIVIIMIIRLKENCECCLENERIGLLQIKSSFPPNTYRVSSWGLDGTDCCNWKGVKCNSTTGHVTLLDLSQVTYPNDSPNWYLNASLFLPFQQLNQLNLRLNNIAGCIENEGFERLSTLTNLEFLDLSLNNFNNSILQSLSGLSSLKSLYLRRNKLNGIINISELNNLTSTLEELNLSENGIEGFETMQGYERLPALTNLEFLDLSLNNFNNSILQFLSGISSLKYLDLGGNKFSRTINISGFERLSTLTNLEKLDLSNNNFSNNILQSLSALPSLKSLDLSGNQLSGTINISGFERLSTLTNLEILGLSYNNFSNSILQSLSGLPSLKSLSLSGNKLSGTINVTELNNLTSTLEELDLSRNEIEGFETMQGFERLSTFTNLEFLDLSSNNFNNSILQFLSGIPSLKSLYLSGNKFSGTINISGLSSLESLDLSNNRFRGPFNFNELDDLSNLQELDLIGNEITKFILPTGMKHLQELYIGGNDLSGNLPWCLANLTSLRTLDLSYNQFSGKISCSLLQSLTFLRYLDLSHNLFQIPTSLTPLFNLSQLKSLYVDDNTIYADTEDHNMNPKFQLEELHMDGYGEGGALPKFLYHQYNLEWLSMSSLKLRGRFPYWLLENNTGLVYLDLTNNSLSRNLQLPNTPHVSLTRLYISDNFFSGYIPTQIGAYFPILESFDMSKNELKGRIPNSLCNSTALQFLDISQNNISGRIPKCIGNMFRLGVLDLSNNNVSASLPSNFSPSFYIVNLSKNRLQGSLKDAFYSCFQLIVLDLSHNNFSGSIPLGIGKLPYISYLVLGYNNLQGEIPIELCKLKQLSFLDLSHNSITGQMLPCLNFTSYWSRKGNALSLPEALEITIKGHTYLYEEKILSYVSGIDVSCNNFTGHIPYEIGDLRTIKAMNLSHNNLTGRIPPTFSNLKEVESLDLSHNNLQGTIPYQLTQLTSLAVFNVSYNNLSGQTPDRVKQFATFDENSYRGNQFLCGWPLSKSCTAKESPPSNVTTSPFSQESSNNIIDMEVFYVSFGVAYIMVLLSLVAILCINPYWRRLWFYYVQMSIDKAYYFFIDDVIPLFSRLVS